MLMMFGKKQIIATIKIYDKNGVNCSHTSYEIIDKDDKKIKS